MNSANLNTGSGPAKKINNMRKFDENDNAPKQNKTSEELPNPTSCDLKKNRGGARVLSRVDIFFRVIRAIPAAIFATLVDFFNLIFHPKYEKFSMLKAIFRRLSYCENSTSDKCGIGDEAKSGTENSFNREEIPDVAPLRVKIFDGTKSESINDESAKERDLAGNIPACVAQTASLDEFISLFKGLPRPTAITFLGKEAVLKHVFELIDGTLENGKSKLEDSSENDKFNQHEIARSEFCKMIDDVIEKIGKEISCDKESDSFKSAIEVMKCRYLLTRSDGLSNEESCDLIRRLELSKSGQVVKFLTALEKDEDLCSDLGINSSDVETAKDMWLRTGSLLNELENPNASRKESSISKNEDNQTDIDQLKNSRISFVAGLFIRNNDVGSEEKIDELQKDQIFDSSEKENAPALRRLEMLGGQFAQMDSVVRRKAMQGKAAKHEVFAIITDVEVEKTNKILNDEEKENLFSWTCNLFVKQVKNFIAPDDVLIKKEENINRYFDGLIEAIGDGSEEVRAQVETWRTEYLCSYLYQENGDKKAEKIYECGIRLRNIFELNNAEKDNQNKADVKHEEFLLNLIEIVDGNDCWKEFSDLPEQFAKNLGADDNALNKAIFSALLEDMLRACTNKINSISEMPASDQEVAQYQHQEKMVREILSNVQGNKN